MPPFLPSRCPFCGTVGSQPRFPGRARPWSRWAPRQTRRDSGRASVSVSRGVAVMGTRTSWPWHSDTMCLRRAVPSRIPRATRHPDRVGATRPIPQSRTHVRPTRPTPRRRLRQTGRRDRRCARCRPMRSAGRFRSEGRSVRGTFDSGTGAIDYQRPGRPCGVALGKGSRSVLLRTGGIPMR
jgi:hypothetical protein